MSSGRCWSRRCWWASPAASLGVLVARWGVVGLRGAGADATAAIRRDPRRCRRAAVFAGRVVAHRRAVRRHPRARVRERGRARCAAGQQPRARRRGGQRIRGVLVSSEVALAVVLLIVMTMLAKSFANVQAVAPGFDSTRVLSARLTLPAKRFNNRGRDCHVPAGARRAAVVAADRHADGRDLAASA